MSNIPDIQKRELEAYIMELRDQVVHRDYPYDPNILEKFLKLALQGKFPGLVHESKWHRESGIVHVADKLNGWSGEAWVTYFDLNDILIGPLARQALLSRDYKPGPKGRFYNAKIAEVLDDKSDFGISNLETTCHIWKILKEDGTEKMGFSRIVSMHEESGFSYIQGTRWVNALKLNKPPKEWLPNCGFVHVS